MANQLPDYAELHALSNFSFQRGASHAEELVGGVSGHRHFDPFLEPLPEVFKIHG